MAAKRLFFVIVAGLLSCYSYSQCNITAAASPTSICAGDPVTLTSTGSCGYLMLNDFNNGTIGSGWNSNAAPMFTNPCNPTCDGTTYLWIGPASNFPRQVTTIGFQVGNGCSICFDMKYASQSNGSPCEGPDLNTEGVHLQYSTNGGSSWTDINYWSPNGGYDPYMTSWQHYCENIPSSAWGNNTQFRWYQTNTSGNSFDHWGLDNVEINCPTAQNVQWSHGPTVLNPPVVYPTTTTTYTVTISDPVNGNSDTDQVVVQVSQGASPPSSQGDTICAGQAVTLNASGSTGSYQWYDAANGGNYLGSGTSFTTNPLNTTTTFYVNAFNASGSACPSLRTPVEVYVSNPLVDAGQNQTICQGESLNLQANGSGSLVWNTGATTPTISVSPGSTTTYTVTLTDALSCVATDEVVVNVNSLPAANAGPDIQACGGIQSTLTANGGSSYSWSTGETSSTITVNPTTPTTYTVTVTNSYNCTATDDVVVNAYPDPPADAGNDTNICHGSIAQLQASGGQQYVWSGGGSSAQISVSPANQTTYTVTVTDQNGCSGTDDVIVGVYQLPQANAGADQQICPGSSTQLTASGGIAYNWSSGQSSASINVSPASQTQYIVTVTDNNGCSQTDDVTIDLYPPAIADAGNDTAICFGESVQIFSTGGTTYAWNTGASTPGFVVTPNTTTNYEVTVTDANGCTDSDDILITVNPNPVADAGPNISICEGHSTGLTGSGASNYIWNNGSTSANITVNPVTTTTYSLTVTDIHNCSSTDEVIVTVNVSPTALFSANILNGCQPLSVQFTDNSNPTIAHYSWNFGDPSSGSANTSVLQDPDHIFQDDGLYTVTLIVETDSGCMDSITVNQMIDVYPQPVADFYYNPQPIKSSSPTVHFTENSTNGFMYHWSFGDGGTETIPNPTHTYVNTAGIYNVCLTVYNINGACIDSVCRSLEVIADVIRIPNVITPNGDGYNDRFVIENIENYPDAHLLIYNRWGKKVYESYSYLNEWDGGNCTDGTYFWVLQFKDQGYINHNGAQEQVKELEGTLTIIR